MQVSQFANMQVDAAGDRPGVVKFYGSESAELFTRELEESYHGVLTRNMITDPHDPMVGFASASIDRRPWTDTMWTRDAGVFLRELAQWGYFGHACLLAENLMLLVRENAAGYNSFPERFDRGVPGSGSEMDGTAAIVIGLVLLWERLAQDHPTRKHIEQFLGATNSPLAYMVNRLAHHPLVPGSGEFGSGCGVPGDVYNVVQNNLVRLALLAAQRLARGMGAAQHAADYARCAEQLARHMLQHLRYEDGSWIWCIDPATLQPDPAVVGHIVNRGFGGLNGVLAMSADVLGFDLLAQGWEGNAAGVQTFEKLFTHPTRRAMFDKYGCWTQFDEFGFGYMSGPSYGHGYALQVMLLTDRLAMAGCALDFLAQATHRPPRGNWLTRDSDYLIYERFYLPELSDHTEAEVRALQPSFPLHVDGHLDQGCGALNLVCVAEPLKIARLVVGIDDTSPDGVRIIPRLPPAWSGYVATNWPILTPAGVLRADLRCRREGGRLALELDVRDGARIPQVAVRTPSGEGANWQTYTDVTGLQLIL
jgi:hypothetical protein